MKTITKVGLSAIGAAAVAGFGYLGKKMYDKSKSSNDADFVVKSNIVENSNESTTENNTSSEN